MTVEEALNDCVAEGNVVKLGPTQLDRKVYEGVKKTLERIGGKWKGGKVGGFVFPSDPSELLADVQGGVKRNLKKEFQFFATPAELADRLVRLAAIRPEDEVLEPSAGDGAIIKAIHRAHPGHTVHACEINPVHYDLLKGMKDVELAGRNFLELTIDAHPWDRIIANPPFSKNQDIDHVRHMWSLLADGGRIVAVVSTHWETSENKKETEFREWIEKIGAKVLDVPAGTFKESGTNVPAKILAIKKGFFISGPEDLGWAE